LGYRNTMGFKRKCLCIAIYHALAKINKPSNLNLCA
jgi:hypothetical protein